FAARVHDLDRQGAGRGYGCIGESAYDLGSARADKAEFVSVDQQFRSGIETGAVGYELQLLALHPGNYLVDNLAAPLNDSERRQHRRCRSGIAHNLERLRIRLRTIRIADLNLERMRGRCQLSRQVSVQLELAHPPGCQGSAIRKHRCACFNMAAENRDRRQRWSLQVDGRRMQRTYEGNAVGSGSMNSVDYAMML